jgi:hypothetical protein
VVGVDPEPGADGVQRVFVLLGGELLRPVVGPLLTDVVGRPERRRVVHDGAAAEAAAREEGDLAVGRRLRCERVEVEEPRLLAAVEVALVVVVARLEDDDVEAGRGQDAGRRAAAGAGADDDHVTGELRVRGRPQRGQLRRRYVVAGAERSRIAHRVPDRRSAAKVVGKERRTLERPEESAPGA